MQLPRQALNAPDAEQLTTKYTVVLATWDLTGAACGGGGVVLGW